MFHKITPSRELSTDDSILTLTNGSGSPGDTSASSLTWAEDAVRQNKEEWDKIERTLYGEEALPKDKALRDELLHWMHAFPHLRINGKSAQMHYSSNLKPADPNYSEIFAIHPQTQSARTRQDFLESELEECLTINSGIATSPVPSEHHRTAVIYKPPDNHTRPNIFPKILPSILSKNCLIEKIKTLEVDKSGRVTRGRVTFRTYEPLITYSAKSLISSKLPQPTTNIFFRKDLQLPSPINSKSATPRIKASVTLPAISVTTPPTLGIAGRSLDSGVIGRSISATNIPHRKHVKFKFTLPDVASDND